MHPRVPTLLTPSNPPRHRRALTFMELMVAMCVTAAISAVMAVLISSTAAGTNSQNDGRRSLVKMQATKALIQDTIVNAQCVLASGSNYLILWTGDIPGAKTTVNAAVNLSELQLLEVDTTTGNVNLYTTTFPGNWDKPTTNSNDTTYAATTSWYNAVSTAKANPYFLPTVLATNATSMTVSLDNVSPTQAQIVTLVINFSDTSYAGTRQIVIGARLPNPAVPW